MQKRPLSGWSDPGNFVQRILGDVGAALLPMRPDSKAMRFIAQALQKIKDWRAFIQTKRCATFDKELLATSVSVNSFGYANDFYLTPHAKVC